MKIGYKATKNMKCLTLTYEVGKTYTMDNIQICSHGFHYCEVAHHVLDYYYLTKDFVLLELEILGQTMTEGNKSVTDKVRVIRVIPEDEYEAVLGIKLDNRGNIIWQKFDNGVIEETEYDSRNNKIKCTYNGKTDIWEYDDLNRNTLFKCHSGEWRKMEYYPTGNNPKRTTTSTGGDAYFTYDENGYVSSVTTNGVTRYHKHDALGNVTYTKNQYGVEDYWDRDEKGNITHCKSFDGKEMYNTYEYDHMGNRTYSKMQDMPEIRWEHTYDEAGTRIRVVSSIGEEVTYNNRGDITMRKTSWGVLHLYEYTYEYTYDEKDNLLHFKSPYCEWTITIS